MFNRVTISVYCTLMIISCGRPMMQKHIYGIWNGKYLDKILIINFNEDETCEINIFDEHFNFSQKLKGDFKINNFKKPISLSIKNIEELPHPLYTILKYKGPNSIVLGEFSPKWKLRKTYFDPMKSIILNRINNK